MKSSRIGLLAAALAVFLSGAAASPAAGEEQASDRLARQIVGWYDGVAGPDNHIRVIVQPGQPVAGRPSTYQFQVTLQGKYNDSNVSLLGALVIEPQGDGARLAWATRRSTDCQVDIHPAGDGFEGTSGANACQTGFQSPTPGRWEFQMEPGSLRIRSVETGETLRFRKIEEKR
jgi:hypothetical protein